MKDLLEHIEETWKMTQIGPEHKILRNYAEQNRILTIQYACKCNFNFINIKYNFINIKIFLSY